ncbi:MAG: formate/nitrite transporter family protein [Haloarculaceae archaeon]
MVPDRFSSDEVFQRIVADADHEITSGARELIFSALAGGLAITITLLVYASMYPRTDSSVVAALLYPIGFIYIIIGGYQLYTGNTLPPVALTLERLASVPALFRHWSIVAADNFAGGAIGAIVLAYGGVFGPEAAAVAADLALEGVYETSRWELFFKRAFAGLIVVGVVWVNFAASDTISRLVVVYLAFLTIPMGDLFHVVVSFTESVSLLHVVDGPDDREAGEAFPAWSGRAARSPRRSSRARRRRRSSRRTPGPRRPASAAPARGQRRPPRTPPGTAVSARGRRSPRRCVCTGNRDRSSRSGTGASPRCTRH